MNIAEIALNVLQNTALSYRLEKDSADKYIHNIYKLESVCQIVVITLSL